ERVQAVDVDVVGGDVAGGLAARASHAVVVRNTLDVTVTAERTAGGVVGALSDGVDVTTNLVSAAVTVRTDGGAGTEGVHGALVGALPGTGSDSTVTRNVALIGTIAYSGTVDGYAGRIVGYTGYDGWLAEQNLASTEITVGGAMRSEERRVGRECSAGGRPAQDDVQRVASL